MRIFYRIGSSPLGRMLVAATEHGICMVDLGENDADLVKALHREYPKAIVADSKEAQGHFDAVLGYFSGHQKKIALDLRGTDFQRKVWTALQTIPEGSVCSYSDVAALIGQPKAVQGRRERLREESRTPHRPLPQGGAQGRGSGRLRPRALAQEGAPRGGEEPDGRHRRFCRGRVSPVVKVDPGS